MKLIFWWYHFPIEKRLSDEFQTASFQSLQFSYFPRIRGSPEAAAKDSLACLVFVVCHSRLQDAAEYACSDGTSTAVDDTEAGGLVLFFGLCLKRSPNRRADGDDGGSAPLLIETVSGGAVPSSRIDDFRSLGAKDGGAVCLLSKVRVRR